MCEIVGISRLKIKNKKIKEMSDNGYPSFAECIAIFKKMDKRASALTSYTSKKVPDMKVIAQIKRILDRYWVSARFERRAKMEREI